MDARLSMDFKHILTLENMTLNIFVNKVKSSQEINFADSMHIINEFYDYTPTRFSNGLGNQAVINEASTNEGSCKIFAFAQLQQLDQEQTLKLFGEYYQEVLNDPQGTGHQNIRNFMHSGWGGIQFNEQNTLRLK
ncbi:HopJ type III effector protein [Methyloprofundus sp.]|uniref:HopJ type III effector protein n=1 Tax=Methyloprofundus sp. TaxID=2020875 RepID=UPI003D0B2744